jgi:hypothetical protein
VRLIFSKLIRPFGAAAVVVVPGRGARGVVAVSSECRLKSAGLVEIAAAVPSIIGVAAVNVFFLNFFFWFANE